jgi:hypothetical protein
MHTEQIRNLHPGWVVGGWLVAVAVAGAVFMVLVGVGLAPPGAPQVDALVLAAVAAGFFAGGLFVGLRWSNAPILHGAAITFLSVLVWFVGELLAPGALAASAADAGSVLGLILLQLSASVAGGWVGRTLVRRGETPTFEG